MLTTAGGHALAFPTSIHSLMFPVRLYSPYNATGQPIQIFFSKYLLFNIFIAYYIIQIVCRFSETKVLPPFYTWNFYWFVFFLIHIFFSTHRKSWQTSLEGPTKWCKAITYTNHGSEHWKICNAKNDNVNGSTGKKGRKKLKDLKGESEEVCHRRTLPCFNHWRGKLMIHFNCISYWTQISLFCYFSVTLMVQTTDH